MQDCGEDVMTEMKPEIDCASDVCNYSSFSAPGGLKLEHRNEMFDIITPCVNDNKKQSNISDNKNKE